MKSTSDLQRRILPSDDTSSNFVNSPRWRNESFGVSFDERQTRSRAKRARRAIRQVARETRSLAPRSSFVDEEMVSFLISSSYSFFFSHSCSAARRTLSNHDARKREKSTRGHSAESIILRMINATRKSHNRALLEYRLRLTLFRDYVTRALRAAKCVTEARRYRIIMYLPQRC